MINRRGFLRTVSGSLLAVSSTGSAQPVRKVYRIGILTHGGAASDMVGPEPRSRFVNTFVRGLHELGYVYGG